MIGFTDEEWAKLQKSKLPEVKKLSEMWEAVFSNPAYEIYIASKIQTDKWNREIRENPTTIKSLEGLANKEFEYSLKYLLEGVEFAKRQKELQDMLTPDEVKNAKSEIIKHQGGLESITHDIYQKNKAGRK